MDADQKRSKRAATFEATRPGMIGFRQVCKVFLLKNQRPNLKKKNPLKS